MTEQEQKAFTAMREALEKPAYTHALALQNISEALELVIRWIDDYCDTGPDTGFEAIESKVNEALTAAKAVQPQAQGEPEIKQGVTPVKADPLSGLMRERDSSGVEGHIVPAKRWPFVETPAEFTERLHTAYREFGTMLAAVRCVLIEQPPIFAAHPQATEPAWRPIESAPKDGTKFLAWWGPEVGKPVITYWLDNSNTRTPWAGWIVPSMQVLSVHSKATLWMPLPAAPEAK